MYKFLVIFLLSLWYSSVHAQAGNDKIMFYIDSLPVTQDPQPDDILIPSDVAEIVLIKNKDSLKMLGLERFDGVSYIFTKAYRNRDDSVRRIPTSKQMVRKNRIWYLKDTMYSGPFIDYYYNGKKQGDGIFTKGKLSGRRRIYYQNGAVLAEKQFVDGLESGLSEEYYDNGVLRQKGIYANGQEQGIWYDYYPNGQIELQGNYLNGDITDSVYKYYSSGRIKEIAFIHDGQVKTDPQKLKIDGFIKKSKECSTTGDIKGAIMYCNKIIELDSRYADAYFSKATLELNDEKFDLAITDFDLALKYEPYMKFALANRAFARIRRHDLSNSRSVFKNSEVTVLAGKDADDIPASEKEKICADLKQALFLGDKAKIVFEARSKYCQ